MKKRLLRFAVVFLAVGSSAFGGELTYMPIPATQSDASSGISPANQYTTALDAGSAANRVLNGVTLNASPGEGQAIMANNAAITALSGSLMITSGQTDSLQADGTLREVLSDVIYNNGAGDNSQQEIVLDPKSLVAGTTYDLRVYVANAGGGQDRQVNLSFVGDGQAATETGFFNEDDARTSAGGFQDPNQVYCINYRFTWDGQSTPGITVSQKSGQAPFVLYALTNHPVAQAQAAAPPPAPVAPAPVAGGGQALTTGMVTAESDQIGVTSDTFYSDERLNRNGRWIEIKKYGRCWQPTSYSQGWRPYLRGRFGHCGDCGWTWISDPSEEEWGWAVYHYGRWARVPGVGCGWAWVPGTVWSGAWVSWRQGQVPDCTCVGWAPLPPEAICKVNVGISKWVDREYDIGPDYWTFVHVRDFGSRSYSECGRCILDRRRYVNIVEHTTNITNISYTNINVNVNVNVTNINVYNGGPDFKWTNQEIQKQGGQAIEQIHINHVSEADLKGGKGSHLEGNTLALFSPKVTTDPKPKFVPKVVTTVPDSKIDHGWNEIKDKKIKNDLKTKIAEQSKGLTPETTKATLPAEVAEKIKDTKQAGASPSPGLTATVSPGAKGTATPAQTATASPAATGTASPGKSPDAKMTPLAGQSPTAAPAGTSPSLSAADRDAAIKLGLIAAPSPSLPASPSPKAGQSPSASPAGTASPGATMSADEIKKQDPFGILKKGSPTASPSPKAGQSPLASPAGTASPTATMSADDIKKKKKDKKDPFGILEKGSPSPAGTASPSPAVTASPGAKMSPVGTASPATTASPTRTFPETYKPPLTLKSPTPGATGTATPAATTSPGKFPETYKPPLTLKSPTPGATGTAAPAATASPARSFPETYKAPLTLKSPTPGATGTATPAVTASPAGKSVEGGFRADSFKAATATPSALPKVIRSVAPTTSPVPTIGKAWTYTPTPQPTIMSTPKATPIKTPPPVTATPRPTITPDAAAAAAKANAAAAAKAQADAAAKAQQLNQQKLQQQQLMQQKQAQDAAAAKANADAAAKANAAAAAKAQQQQLQQKQLQDANAAAAAKANAAAAAKTQLQQQQLMQQKQAQDAAAKANAAAAAKAQQQQLQQQQQLLQQQKQQQLQQQQQQQLPRAPKPTPTPTPSPTPIH